MQLKLHGRIARGTIPINAVGSLVIGFFATLTATGGRVAVSLDLRACVMTGV